MINLPRICLLLAPLVLLSCAAPVKKSLDQVINDAVENQSTEIAQDDTDTPEYYIRLASQTDGEVRYQHLLKAAELLIQRGDVRLAQDQLQTLDQNQLEGNKQSQIKLLAARIALVNNNPVQALELLPDPFTLNYYQALDAAYIRADANFMLGYYMQAVETRVRIEHRLEADDEREANHQSIWLALSSLPNINLNQATSDNEETTAWIELARIMRQGQTRLDSLQERIIDWGTRYPDHPVTNRFIDTILDAYLRNDQGGESVALLLPLEGKFSNAAKAIQSGFITAHYANQSPDNIPKLRFYDTSDSQTDIESVYQRALQDGASTIIGPMDKAFINKLAQRPGLDVPVLTLNYAENPLSTTDNLYQFGLLPEDEAVQAAELAFKDNRNRAAVFTPDSSWGKRLQDAFKKRFEELGGKVVSIRQYDTKKDDYSKPIKAMFDIDDSNRRHRDLERLIHMKLKFQPYRRQDIDMIFLAATSRSARGIMPAFKFHRAGDLPVYATSHVFTGIANRTADQDLNGIIFCDLPWILTSQNEMKDTFESQWPTQKAFTRLFAMGIDAYYLVRNLNYLNENDFARFPGETGNLYLDEQKRVHRELVWAQFKRGLPVYLDTHVAPAITPSEDGTTPDETTPANRTMDALTIENNG